MNKIKITLLVIGFVSVSFIYADGIQFNQSVIDDNLKLDERSLMSYENWLESNNGSSSIFVSNLGNGDSDYEKMKNKKISFTPDSKFMLIGELPVKLIELESGNVIREFPGRNGVISSNGQYVYSIYKKELSQYNVFDGSFVSIHSFNSDIEAIDLSPDQKYIAVSLKNGFVGLYNSSYYLIKTLKEISYTGRTNRAEDFVVTHLSFSNDSSLLLGGSFSVSRHYKSENYGISISEKRTNSVWNVSDGNKIDLEMKSECILSPDGQGLFFGDSESIYYYNIKSQKKTFFAKGNTSRGFSISNDGRYLLGLGRSEANLWEIKNGRLLKSFANTGNETFRFVNKPNQSLISISTSDGILRLWDVKSLSIRKEIELLSSTIRGFDIASDSSSLILSDNGNPVIYDVMSTNLISALSEKHKLSNQKLEYIDISDDNRYFAFSNGSDKVMIGDISNNSIIKTVVFPSSPILRCMFMPDSNRLLAGTGSGEIFLADIKSNQIVSTIDLTGGYSYGISAYDISSDGMFLASMIHGSDRKGEIEIWNISSERKFKTIDLREDSLIRDLSYSLDGKYLGVVTTNSMYILNAKTGEVGMKKVYRESNSDSSIATTIHFSDDAKEFYISRGNITEVYSTHSTRLLRSIPAANVKKVRGHDLVVSIKSNRMIEFRKYSDGLLLATTILNKDKSPITWTKDGFFSGDFELAKKAVMVVDGMNCYPIDQFFNTFYRPDLVSMTLQGKDMDEYTRIANINTIIQDKGIAPIVEILTTQQDHNVERNYSIRFKISDQGGGIGDVYVFNGDIPVLLSNKNSRGLKVISSDTDRRSNLRTIEYEAILTLRYGENSISACAYNDSNTIESIRDSINIQYGTKTVIKPNLHIMTVAVQKYRDRALQLNYTVNDANALASSLKSKSADLYESVNIHTLMDGDVTKDKFNTAFSSLSPQINPDDVFVLFFAGHGVTNEKDGDYYFLPANFRYNGSQSVVNQGISKQDILNNLVKIQAQKSILLFDTCNSGSFINGPSTRGIAEKTAIDRLIRGVGRAMIMASADDEVALEGIDDHGVFTYSMLQGLNGKADISGDGYISIKELSTWIETSVPDLTYEKWGYEQVPQSNLPSQDFPIAGR